MSGQLAAAQAYQQWLREGEAAREAAAAGAARDCEGFEPLISIALPVFDPDEALLEAAIESVIGQRYTRWQLCIADDASADNAVRETIRRYSDSDPRIQAVRLDENRGIAAATNAALAMARGDFTALLDHDDLLAPEALTWLADTLRQHPQARLMYSDSDRIDSRGERAEPYFKPDWNYDLLLCHNYFNHLTAYHTGLLRDIGGLRDGFEGSQDYDLALRAVERVGPGQIVHIPRLLYHWRRHDKSLTATRLREAAAGARRAVAAHLERSGTPAQVRANPLALVYQRVLWPDPGLSMAALVFGENEAAVQRTRAVFGERGSLSLDTRVGSQEVLSRALRDWVDSQEADLLCFVRAGIEPRQGDPLVDLRRFFARAAVQAAGAALLAAGDEVCPPVYTKPFRERSGTPGLHRRLGASNHCLAVMDQVTARLAGDCVVVRRAAFGDLCDFSGEAFELRATIDGPCEMIWTPHTAVGEQAQPTAP